MHFDVLMESWIPAVDLEHKRAEYGLLYVLENAHMLSEVLADNPLETYAVQRTLIAFLMDAYGLEDVFDRADLLEKGRFDPAILQAYVERCKEEGVRFDLFDPECPFMQAAFDPAIDEGREKRAVNLFHALPSGNNHVHFDHRLEQDRSFTPAECLRGMLASYVFATAMAQGYPSSVNDTPCYYVLIRGENLFETLMLSMLSKAESLPNAWDMPPVAWRDRTPVERKDKPYTEVSMLAGLTWQPRRIMLKQEEHGSLEMLWYSQGRNFAQNGLWRDPHVSFIRSKKGELYSLKPSMGREAWRDVGIFALEGHDQRSEPATIIKAYKNVLSGIRSSAGGSVLLELFGLATNQAKYEGWAHDRLNVPASILCDPYRAERLRWDMAMIEDVAVALGKKITWAAYRILEQKSKKIPAERALSEEYKTAYFAQMHHVVFGRYLKLLAEADPAQPGWEQRAMAEINLQAISTARALFAQAMKRLGNTGRNLEAQAKARGQFEKELGRIMKNRTVEGMVEGDA